uniref:Protein Star-like n=1 Tax=Diabrotica virgifera virgifera TaxID=50390 RepID=A0A6P7FNK8_DIAVI
MFHVLVKNIAPYCQTQLALLEVDSIAKLREYEKKLEARKEAVESYVPPSRRIGNVLEPDLDYVAVDSSSSVSVDSCQDQSTTSSVVCGEVKNAKPLKDIHKGFFIEAGAYGDGKSKTEWLEENLGWQGLLIQPDPRHYFSLRRHNRKHSQAIHGCISPSPHPKEVSLHPENGGIKVNSIRSSLLDMDDSDWFNTRVKCFPLYSLLLATNVTNIDYLILETGGTELQVLETVPFERTNIEVINVQVRNNDTEKDTLKKFLALKKYKFMENFNESYVFMLTH